jgi:hypothetical protein
MSSHSAHPGLSLVRLFRLNRSDTVWPHHLIVLVLKDVAMPYVLASIVECHFYPCNLAGISNDRILAASFPWFWRHGL